ncbi:hypothetical protein TNIN_123991 [Trichonephila inaurata madagascariensis]|uniref:Uncharacterized protein n=1 Tax=Trichonephila inaurata madagascariensis TaxID=2747483 RepID=A0A8X6IPH7_9ARAC|nr:hypothetical protein TNIN_123991 [Trichonephila inaurata madagascariensis]
MLGMTLKSLTSSRKIIDIINRYGHCISYQGIKELEKLKQRILLLNNPVNAQKRLKKNPALFTGVAYDNFVETTNGKDTLHDMVGIIYQNIEANTIEESEVPEELNMSETSITNNKNNLPHSTKKKKGEEELLKPYLPKRFHHILKNPKMMSELQSTIDDTEIIHSTNSQLYTEINNTWMISHVIQLPDVPMWVGFNTRIYNNDRPQQLISYLTPINASPTSTSIVLETMQQSKKIAEDLRQCCIQVTCDLAIAKVAFQIQATEKPKFDNLFIHLGPFHIMMAYFKAVGKVISDCGLTNIMAESSLLTNGSVNGFLDGKHFNHCKRLHPLVALGLKVLNFKSFLQHDNITLTDDIIEEVKRLQNCETSSFHIENEDLKKLMNNYNISKQRCLSGEHGKA